MHQVCSLGGGIGQIHHLGWKQSLGHAWDRHRRKPGQEPGAKLVGRLQTAAQSSCWQEVQAGAVVPCTEVCFPTAPGLPPAPEPSPSWKPSVAPGELCALLPHSLQALSAGTQLPEELGLGGALPPGMLHGPTWATPLLQRRGGTGNTLGAEGTAGAGEAAARTRTRGEWRKGTKEPSAIETQSRLHGGGTSSVLGAIPKPFPSLPTVPTGVQCQPWRQRWARVEIHRRSARSWGQPSAGTFPLETFS